MCTLCRSSRTKKPVVRVELSDPPPVLVIHVEYKALPGATVSLKESGKDPIEGDASMTTGGCRIDTEIQFGGRAYELVGSIMHTPGHFWAIVWYKDQIWHYGDGEDGDVYVRTSAPGQPYVTTGGQEGCPNVILYVRKDSRVDDGETKVEKMTTDDIVESKGTESEKTTKDEVVEIDSVEEEARATTVPLS